jgi:phage baseplate assembly protein W
VTVKVPDEKVTPGYKPGTVPKSDIKISKDYNAIRNSLTNLFNTLPGQRFLFPDYGLDIRQFLFTPITQDNGRSLGSRIYSVINKYEPRVKIVNIHVESDPDNSRYNISLVLGFPTLKTTNTVNYALDLKNQTFIVLPS